MGRPRSPHGSLTAVVLLGVGTCGGCSEPVSLSCPPSVGDVVVVDNPLEGRWSIDGATPRLTEEWRVRLPEDVEPLAPEAAGLRDDGTLTIVELGAGTITQFDPDRGVAVSESPLPAEVIAAIRGSITDERLPAPVLRPHASGGFLVALPPQLIPGGADQRRVSFVVRVGPDAAFTDTLYAAAVTVLNDHGFVEWPRPGTRTPLVAVGPGGSVALAGASSDYRIDLLRPDFKDSLVVCRQAPALPLTESESGAVEVSGSPSGLSWLLDVSKKVQPPLPFGRIFLGHEGRLWVQRERPDPQRVYAHPGGAAYDVFAAGGAYLGEVRAPPGVVLIADRADLVYGIATPNEGPSFLLAFGLR